MEDGFVGRVVARTTVSCPCMPMYPGPPSGCVPEGCGYEFGFIAYNPHHGGIPPVASLRARDPSDGRGGVQYVPALDWNLLEPHTRCVGCFLAQPAG